MNKQITTVDEVTDFTKSDTSRPREHADLKVISLPTIKLSYAGNNEDFSFDTPEECLEDMWDQGVHTPNQDIWTVHEGEVTDQELLEPPGSFAVLPRRKRYYRATWYEEDCMPSWTEIPQYQSENHYYLRSKDWTVFTLRGDNPPVKGQRAIIDGQEYQVEGVDKHLYLMDPPIQAFGIAVKGNVFNL